VCVCMVMLVLLHVFQIMTHILFSTRDSCYVFTLQLIRLLQNNN
jgi:hypothetical protein